MSPLTIIDQVEVGAVLYPALEAAQALNALAQLAALLTDALGKGLALDDLLELALGDAVDVLVPLADAAGDPLQAGWLLRPLLVIRVATPPAAGMT